ncbi:hypothetical protein OESDEN_06227 [Oesophagostomum dentatum]|uniref:Uncharacterized protein n=1 Tax=Oesophagostomum dentatum TaxID=61180 RepID=A0A0B1TDE7_OESDE|nr:hypothetical protein OESDEN_06227 [Oesophagostomum dentatum]
MACGKDYRLGRTGGCPILACCKFLEQRLWRRWVLPHSPWL